ncbi:MAG: hypothetical protein M3O09_05780, partial [Acidobacteriota bacterium]|nr:hypothetical protein [Acidobacteriota bacterium]
MKTSFLKRIVPATQADKKLHGKYLGNIHCHHGLVAPNWHYRDNDTGKHILTLIRQVIPKDVY